MVTSRNREWVPLPRYPFFLHPTSDIWFRTTVNPVVWHLVEEQRLFADHDARSSLVASAAVRGELLIDAWRWVRDPLESEDIPLYERIKSRPDVLLNSDFVHRLFGLLTSGRSTDQRYAERLWKALSKRHDGAPPAVATTERYVDSTWGGPSPNRPRREKLQQILKAQAAIWRMRLNRTEGPEQAIIDEIRGPLKLSGNHVRNHLRAFAQYVELLESDDGLLGVGSKLFPAHAQDAPSIAMASLEDAVYWLGRP